jgi:arylsulfate sulfotransferase
MKRITVGLFVILLFVLSSCKKDQTTTEAPATVTGSFVQAQIINQSVTPNPSGYAPLTASIEFSTSIATRAQIRVVGKNGSASDVIKMFDTLSLHHVLPVLGLYAGYANTVELTLFDSANNALGTSSVSIQTAGLNASLPAIAINTSQSGKRPGMTMVNYLATVMPFVFDEFGDIRWYLDFRQHPTLSNLNYDVGPERLRNGNLYFGDINSAAIYEVDMMGYVLNTWSFPGYIFHHRVCEKPNGNFIVSVSKQGLSTIEDQIIEIDRQSKQIVNTWDLRQSMQYSRQALTTNTSDWLHVNSVEYDSSDNTIIVSGRTQGVVKLDYSNKVVWLLAPHHGWGLSGDGTDLNTKLLQPLDASGNPITDTSVLSGFNNHPDFEWNWCQHAVKVAPGGNLSLFDNGDQRNWVAAGPYSRAVIYHIDPVAMTVQQLWRYGKSRGAETYSRIVSDVDIDADLNHVVFSPGAIQNNGASGRVVEVDKTTSAILFEATITPPDASAAVTFHRTQRLSLYP